MPDNPTRNDTTRKATKNQRALFEKRNRQDMHDGAAKHRNCLRLFARKQTIGSYFGLETRGDDGAGEIRGFDGLQLRSQLLSSMRYCATNPWRCKYCQLSPVHGSHSDIKYVRKQLPIVLIT